MEWSLLKVDDHFQIFYYFSANELLFQVPYLQSTYLEGTHSQPLYNLWPWGAATQVEQQSHYSRICSSDLGEAFWRSFIKHQHSPSLMGKWEISLFSDTELLSWNTSVNYWMSIFNLESESRQDLTFPLVSDDSKQMFITARFVSASLKSRLPPGMIIWDFSLKVKIYKFVYTCDYVYIRNRF